MTVLPLIVVGACHLLEQPAIDRTCEDLGACDLDGDGWGESGGDCDDADPDVHPGAEEAWYDGVDQDCDGASDYDVDGDGEDAEGWGGADCDDADPLVHPGAAPRCLDGVDSDCDGLADRCPLTDAEAVVRGEAPGDYVLTGAFPGDMDGDGVGDAAFGAIGADEGASGGGAVALFRGPLEGEHTLADAVAVVLGDEPDAVLGYNLAGPGDVDGDGVADLLASAPGFDGYLGAVAMLPGGSPQGTYLLGEVPTLLLGGETGELAGYVLRDAGDVDGDGAHDLLVGAPGFDSLRGRAFLVRGPLSGLSSLDAHAVLEGEQAYDYAGISGCGVGDVDGDGLDDFAVGASEADGGVPGSGVVYVLRGSPSADWDLSAPAARLEGEASGDGLGEAPACAGGDVDGDGRSDVLLGVPAQDLGATDGGVVYVVLGPPPQVLGLASADSRIYASEEGDGLGWDLDAGTDFDGDGRRDPIVAAPSAGGAGEGILWVIHEVPLGTVDVVEAASATVVGADSLAYAGYRVRTGSAREDGAPQLLATSYGSAGTGDGAAWIYRDP